MMQKEKQGAAIVPQEEHDNMTTLLEFREKLKLFYGKYDIYVTPVLKFVLALMTFVMINQNVGFMARLKSPLIVLMMALICSILPVNTIVIFGGMMILAHAYALSLEVFAISAVLILVMFLMYFRVTPEYGYLLVATPLTFTIGVPYALPLVMGLTGTPLTAVPVACGTVIYYLLQYMKNNTTMLSESESDTMQQKMTYLIDHVINNKEMLLMIAAFALTIILVYVIRRLSMDYAWQAAIITGAITDFLVILVGGMMMQTSIRLVGLLLGSVAAVGVAVVLQFFLFNVDYSRTEYVQFEDDEYYYYVKAVPKITIAVTDKRVKKINTQKKGHSMKKSSSHGKPASRN